MEWQLGNILGQECYEEGDLCWILSCLLDKGKQLPCLLPTWKGKLVQIS